MRFRYGYIHDPDGAREAWLGIGPFTIRVLLDERCLRKEFRFKLGARRWMRRVEYWRG